MTTLRASSDPAAVAAPVAPGWTGFTNPQLGMLVFIASEVMFFVGLIGAHIVLRLGDPAWAPVGDLGTPTRIFAAFVGTLLLVLSSLTLSAGVRRRLRALAWTTVLLGAVFVLHQLVEFRHLAAIHVGVRSSVAASSFYLLTSMHLLHVVAGLAAVAWQLPKLGDEDRSGLLAVTTYWHFVGVVWVVLFAILYLWR